MLAGIMVRNISEAINNGGNNRPLFIGIEVSFCTNKYISIENSIYIAKNVYRKYVEKKSLCKSESETSLSKYEIRL